MLYFHSTENSRLRRLQIICLFENSSPLGHSVFSKLLRDFGLILLGSSENGTLAIPWNPSATGAGTLP